MVAASQAAALGVFLLCSVSLVVASSVFGVPVCLALPRRGAFGFRWLVRWSLAFCLLALQVACRCGAVPFPSFSLCPLSQEIMYGCFLCELPGAHGGG